METEFDWRDAAAKASRQSPLRRGRDRRKATRDDGSEQTRNKPPAADGLLELANSTIVLEDGGAGTLARVERDGCVDYAGPLPAATIDALLEVAD